MKNHMADNRCILNPILFDNRKKYLWFNRDKLFREGILKSLKILLYNEVYFEGFATNDLIDVGLKIFNKEVVSIDTLNEDSAIVFTYTKYEGIQELVCQPLVIQGIESKGPIKGDNIENPEKMAGFQLKEGTFLRVYRIVEMLTLLNNKKVFIYGNNSEAECFSRYLRLLDFGFEGFLCDYEDLNREVIDGYKVNSIEEYLYEDNGFVIIVNEKPTKSMKTMEGLGYKYGIDFVLVEPFAAHFMFVRENALDINLGNTYIGASKYAGVQIKERNILNKYPGFCIYGEDVKENYKIAVLGGSTTDGNMFPFRSWPEILYEKIRSDKITIYNGGVSGYTSGQELLKLIRDVLQIKPDMLLVFDGFNDTCQGDPTHPYSFSYAKEIYEYGSRNLEDAYVMNQIGSDLCEGIEVKQTRFENWRNNMELMYTIAESKGIKFYAFLQPMLRSKKRARNEEGIFLSSRQFYEKELYSVEDFRDEMNGVGIKDNCLYLYDLSNIFDDVSDVYMDICHVWEKGNGIIADSIYNIIKSEVG